MFSKQWFEALPEDIQQIIVDTGKELAAWQRQAVADEEKGYLQTIQASGTEIITLSASEKAKMKEVTLPVHKQLEDIVGKDFLEKTYAEINKLSQ